MKRLLGTLFAATLVLSACSQDDTKEDENKKSESTTEKKADDKEDKKSKEEKKSQENEDNKSTQEDNSTEEQDTQETATNEQQQAQQPATQEQQTQQVNNNQRTPQPNQNVKLPKNTEIDDQYIHGEVANALDRKTEIERQANEDYENGKISESEMMNRQQQASQILNQAVENQYGPQD